MSKLEPTQAQIALTQMVAVWRQGEAAEHDPVLINMQARHLAYLERIAPGATEKIRACFEDMKARGVDLGALR